MATLGEIVDRTLALLNSFTTNRPQYATFNGWQASNAGIDLTGSRQDLHDALVELDTEVVFVSDHDASNNSTVCPAWFRRQLGTPTNDSFAAGSRVTINPLWTRYGVARELCHGIDSLYPDLFGVAETELTTSAFASNYELPSNCEGVLHVASEGYGPTGRHLSVERWSFDAKNTDGKKYLRIEPFGVAGRPLRVLYKSKPVTPDPSNLAATWASTGLPDSAADLPELWAISKLLLSTDAAKFQSASVEQADRARFVQAGVTTSVSRRYQEMFVTRRDEEKQKLSVLYPPRVHKTLNG